MLHVSLHYQSVTPFISHYCITLFVYYLWGLGSFPSPHLLYTKIGAQNPQVGWIHQGSGLDTQSSSVEVAFITHREAQRTGVGSVTANNCGSFPITSDKGDKTMGHMQF